MTPKKSLYIFLAVFGLFIVASSAFTVYEYERALILRLGKIVSDNDKKVEVLAPGLHFKLPFIDSVKYFDTRLQTSEIQSTRILTQEKKDVIVDSFIKWRIKDFYSFYTRTGGINLRAEDLLKQRVEDSLRAAFGQRTVKDVVSGERKKIMDDMKTAANDSAAYYGLEVVEVRIKRIDLPAEVSGSVFNRMRSERERIAAEHRARGREKAEIIRAKADASVTVILAQAISEAQKIRGSGDAEAAKIYAESYSKDPEFYAFYRSLDAYRQTFQNKNDILVLNPESPFFRYFNSANSNAAKD